MRRVHFVFGLVLASSLVLAAPGDSEPPATGAAETSFRDIREPPPIGGLPPFAATAGVLLLAGALLLVVRRARRDRQGALPQPAEPRPDPRVQLAELADAHRRGSCPGDQLIVRLDALVRDVLATSTGIRARCRTSAELARTFAPAAAPSGGEAVARPAFAAEARSALGELSDAGWSADPRLGPMLGRLLVLGDRVKFAGHRPDTVEVDDALRAAERLVDALSAGLAR